MKNQHHVRVKEVLSFAGYLLEKLHNLDEMLKELLEIIAMILTTDFDGAKVPTLPPEAVTFAPMLKWQAVNM